MLNMKQLKTAITALVAGDQLQAKKLMKEYIAVKSATILAEMQGQPGGNVRGSYNLKAIKLIMDGHAARICMVEGNLFNTGMDDEFEDFTNAVKKFKSGIVCGGEDIMDYAIGDGNVSWDQLAERFREYGVQNYGEENSVFAQIGKDVLTHAWQHPGKWIDLQVNKKRFN